MNVPESKVKKSQQVRRSGKELHQKKIKKKKRKFFFHE